MSNIIWRVPPTINFAMCTTAIKNLCGILHNNNFYDTGPSSESQVRFQKKPQIGDRSHQSSQEDPQNGGGSWLSTQNDSQSEDGSGSQGSTMTTSSN